MVDWKFYTMVPGVPCVMIVLTTKQLPWPVECWEKLILGKLIMF